ncbi:uncharacterized protein HD556DRAFT_1395731 [Suillus plorans]|uniref:DUF6533 domain-containing protein n=1 Tax=Suillus plorans TaxID=116603 RepID=A0A9P7DDF5_9AGAM|nr:uncharacterized protein HD556DRAFT_1395731 [Suillus plorans]KAG1789693.1 hypothetical protein HD556DRAFT_1395731 [Suillus plorans]
MFSASVLIYPRPLSNSLIQTYDYACSFHEWTFLLRSHWSKMKGLYIFTRYLPFIILAVDLRMSLTPSENSSTCEMLQNVNSGLGIVIATFFILRTYVLWDKNRILLTAMLSNLLSFLIASFIIVFAINTPAEYATSPIPGIAGCYLSSTIFLYFIPSLLLSIFQLGFLILTLIRAIQDWPTNTSRLYVVLVNHNIAYYACGFRECVNISNTLFDRALMLCAPVLILASLATRMHLHLWQVNQHPRDGALVSMSDISFDPMA